MKEIINFLKKFWLLILTIIILPFLFKVPALVSFMDFSNSNNAADAINGFTAPIIGVISIILIYLTFEKQREAYIKLEKDNNFNFIFSEFKRIEEKIYEVTKLYSEFKLITLNSEDDKENFINLVNKINYSILTFNNLISIFDLSKFEVLTPANKTIDPQDLILLKYINSLYSIVYSDSLDLIHSKLLELNKRNKLDGVTIHILEFNSEKQTLSQSIDTIKKIITNQRR